MKTIQQMSSRLRFSLVAAIGLFVGRGWRCKRECDSDDQ